MRRILLLTIIALGFWGCSQKEKELVIPNKSPQVPVINTIKSTELNCKLPYQVRFEADVVNITGNEFYQWTIDGQTYTSKMPIVQISDTGTYQVELKVINDIGEGSFSLSIPYLDQSLPVIAKMQVQVYNNNYRAPSKIRFTNESSRATSVSWEFGDGFESTLDQPEHTYDQPGTYTVKLHAYCEADTQTVSQDITIEPEPTTIRFDKFEILSFPKNYFPERDDDDTHGGDFYVTLNFNNFEYGKSDVIFNKSKLPCFWETPDDWNGDYTLFFVDNTDYEIYLMDRNDNQDAALLLAEYDGLYLKSVFYPRFLDFQYQELKFRISMSYED